MKITAILPVSRTHYLDRVIESLEKQTLKPNNLLVIFDGEQKDFIEVRNKIVSLKYESVVCVKSRSNRLAFNIPDRRLRIVELHKHFQELLGETEWIFSIEDDGILPEDALERLVKVAKQNEDVGMVTGVELGRWGVPYVGAWIVDNPDRPAHLTSMENKAHDPCVEPTDAAGLYCALIRAGKYKTHHFTCANGLGPDVNLGLYLRREGYNNFIDWGIPVTHLNTLKGGEEIEISPLGESKVVNLKLLQGNIWQAYR